MPTELIPVDRLRPAPYNPRVPLKPGDPGWERLRRSLQEFSLVQPIVWNRRTGHVVAGHQRLEILRHDGAAAVDCVVVDLPLEREQALNVTLNNRAVGSDWDPERLAALVAELVDLPDFDATLTGFDERELQDLLFRPGAGDDGGGDGDGVAPDDAGRRDAPPENDIVSVALEVPLAQWETARALLDALLASCAGTRLHVRPPAARA